MIYAPTPGFGHIDNFLTVKQVYSNRQKGSIYQSAF
jgi:hypothetical protein